ncbi:MAG: glycosyltransferase family 39 protein, partial [Anaerolineae bacterium]|nr:glycosyltransferase family 39 protein [Anaerolineae bacterium]
MVSNAAARHRWRFALLLIVFAACALRLAGLTAQSLWRDEVDAIRFASRDLPALLANFRRSGENGPLYFLVLRYWWPLFPVFGQPVSPPASDYALRFFSVIPGMAAVPLAAALARRLLSWQTGVLTALLIATAPYLVWYSQEGKMYALVTTLVLAAVLALEAAIRRGGAGRWLLVWLFTTVAAYIHIMALLLIPVGIAWFLLAWPRARARWLGGLATLAGLTLPYIPIALWQVR